MDDRQKVLNLIGLATKAGKTASGEFMTEKSVKSGKAFLVIVSEEASDNTRKMLPICVLTMKFQSTFSVKRARSVMQWERK